MKRLVCLHGATQCGCEQDARHGRQAPPHTSCSQTPCHHHLCRSLDGKPRSDKSKLWRPHRVYAMGTACRVMRSQAPNATSNAFSSPSMAVRSIWLRLVLRVGVRAGRQAEWVGSGWPNGHLVLQRATQHADPHASLTPPPAADAGEQGAAEVEDAPPPAAPAVSM